MLRTNQILEMGLVRLMAQGGRMLTWNPDSLSLIPRL